MKKIKFENGTLVSNAKVEIGGTIYDVTPEQYEGTTPLSASNMNAIQDNAEEAIDEVSTNLEQLKTDVTNSNVYSTEETKVGTWIDGKPIYRKTIVIEAIASGGQTSIDVSSLNIDTFFINYSKTSYVLTNSFNVSALYSTVENYAQIVDTILSGNKIFIRCKTGTGQIGIRCGSLTIEYTKTTD